MDTKGGKRWGGGDGGGMNWEIGIDMYTLMCIKLMTNKNLLYKKIKFKKNFFLLYTALSIISLGRVIHVLLSAIMQEKEVLSLLKRGF